MFAPGYSVAEAKALIAILANLEGASPPLPQPPLPVGWTLVFDSPQIPFLENKWQLWHDEMSNRYAVAIRGTTNDPGSILEDVAAVMVDASGSLTVGKLSIDYKLADEPLAAVHLGFLLGTLLLLLEPFNGIVAHLLRLPKGSDIFVAGHSQGAAIATLCRAFLNYSNLLADVAPNYKTYVFAQPKPGNDHFGEDFERVVGTGDMFRIANDQDWVPQVPFTIELPRDINEPNPLDLLKNSPLGSIPQLVESAQDQMAKAYLAGQQGQLDKLEGVLRQQRFVATRNAELGAALKIRPTLNYVGCGVEIALAGTPGTNPDDPKDFMWQHHAAMYYQLL